MEDPSVDYSSMKTKAVVGSQGMSTTTRTTIVSSPAEESGWTSYFEDFSNQNHNQEHSFCSSFGSSSMVSDAASFPPWKSSHDHHHHVDSCSSIRDLPRKLTFKKTRTKEISVDDSLEDTASSPVNSPKVSDNLRPVDMNPRRTNYDHLNSSLGNNDRGRSLDQYAGGGMETEAERCDMDYNGKNTNDCTDLKKRGLCLVPLSMLVNYLS